MKAEDRKAVLAACEDPEMLARIRNLITPTRPEVISSNSDVETLLRPKLLGLEEEVFAAVALDRRHRVIDISIITTGSFQFTIVDPAQIFRWALTRKRVPAALIVAHNHPSGDPTPSSQDRDITRRLVVAGGHLNVKVLDHVIMTDSGGSFSFAHNGEIAPAPWQTSYTS